MTKYAYQTEASDLFEGPYDSEQEALNAAITDGELGIGEEISIGEVIPYRNGLSVSEILDNLRDAAISECGEAAEDWPDASTDEEDELESELNEVFHRWCEKTNNVPKFYSVSDRTIVKTILTQEHIDAAQLVGQIEKSK